MSAPLLRGCRHAPKRSPANATAGLDLVAAWRRRCLARDPLGPGDDALRACCPSETYPETVTLIEEYIAQYELTGVTKWRLADKDGQLVGRAGFGQVGNGRELGYTIRRSEWGRGIATGIAAALVQWHLDDARQVLLAHVATPNTASIRVPEKVGFTCLSTKDYQGERCDLRAPVRRTPASMRGPTVDRMAARCLRGLSRRALTRPSCRTEAGVVLAQ